MALLTKKQKIREIKANITLNHKISQFHGKIETC